MEELGRSFNHIHEVKATEELIQVCNKVEL